MIALLLCLTCQLDTMEVKYANHLEVLQSMPEQADIVVREWIASGRSILPYLIRSFETPGTDMFVKEKIALAFGGIADKSALTYLYSALPGASSQLKANIARAIGEMPDPASFDYLLPLLRDQNDAVRGDAIFALGRLGDLRAVTYLVEALKDSVFMNRGRAIIAFGDLRQTDMLPYLAVYRLDPLPQVRTALAAAMGKYRDAAALPILELMVTDDDPTVRREVYSALSLTPGEQGITRFRSVLSDPDPQVRDAGVADLVNYPPETAMPILFEFLSDGNPSVRSSAQAMFESRRPAASAGFEYILTQASYPLDMKYWALRALILNYGANTAVDRLMQIFPDKFQGRLTKIVDGQYEIGMGLDELYLALGKPSRTRANGSTEEWDYDGLGLIFRFQNGILTETEGL